MLHGEKDRGGGGEREGGAGNGLCTGHMESRKVSVSPFAPTPSGRFAL